MFACALAAFPSFAPPAQAAPDRGIEIGLSDADPLIVGLDDELRFTGTLTNHTSEPVTSVTVWWQMKTAVLDFAGYEEWFAGEETVPAITFARQDLPEPLEPGEQRDFHMEIPPESSPFDSASAPGVRGMELVVTGTGEDGASLRDAVRSTMVWTTDSDPTPVSVAVPLTGSPQEWAQATAERSSLAQVSTARLVDLMDRFTGVPVSWGIDAAVVDPVPLGGIERFLADTASSSDSEERTHPLSWERLEEISELVGVLRARMLEWDLTDEARGGGVPVISLGWATPDYGALARTQEGGAELALAGWNYADEVLTTAGLGPIESMAWSLGPIGPGGQAVFPDGIQTVFTPPTTGGGYLPGTGQEPALHAPDAAFAELILGSFSQQELAAQSLLYANSADRLIATLPADLTPSQADRAAENLQFLSELPWFTFTPLTATHEAPQNASLPPLHARSATQTVTTAAQLLRTAESFANITPDPPAFTALSYSAILPTVKYPAVWDSDQADFFARQELLALAQEALGTPALTIQKPSTVNLISQGGTLPIGIENTSTIALAPTVVLEPADVRLRAEDPVQQSLAPQVSTTVHLPIVGVANGDVEATIRLLDAHGEDLAAPQTFTVRVRADWETTGTAIIAGLVGVGFVFGLVRNIRGAPARKTRGE